MDDDNFYEDPEVFDALDKKNKKKEDKEAGQSLSDKFKKNMDKALNKIGTKFNKKKTKVQRSYSFFLKKQTETFFIRTVIIFLLIYLF